MLSSLHLGHILHFLISVSIAYIFYKVYGVTVIAKQILKERRFFQNKRNYSNVISKLCEYLF